MKVLLTIMASLLSLSVYAAKGDKSLSGCGLGWQIAPKMSMVSLTTRGTTNSVTMPFGTTSGTSGCAQHKIVFNEKLRHHMAEVSFDELVAQMAMGKGEHLVAFSRALGCRDAYTGQFSDEVQTNFSRIGASNNSVELVESVQQIISESPSLAQGCTI